MSDIEPIWAWQEFGPDGRWGTIAVVNMKVVDGGMITEPIPLYTREESLARGNFRKFAELHASKAKNPTRLHRFVPDPDFIPETL